MLASCIAPRNSGRPSTAYRYVTHRVNYDRLALSVSHPLYSASHRPVVFRSLVSAKARNRARVHLRL